MTARHIVTYERDFMNSFQMEDRPTGNENVIPLAMEFLSRRIKWSIVILLHPLVL